MNAAALPIRESILSAPLPEAIELPEITHEAKRQLVARITSSPHFNKAPRLTEMLHYITEQSLSGKNGGLREQEIGAVVFGRPEDYDTSQDNIVRVQFGHLRRKLERYFAAEGAAEPLILEIPKGNYVPHFYLRQISELSSAPQEVSTALPLVLNDNVESDVPPLTGKVFAAAAQPSRFWLAGLSAAVLLLAILCGWLWWQNRQFQRLARQPLADTPALHSLWSQLLIQAQPTDIVLADSMFSLFQDRLGAQFTLQEYLNGGFETKLPNALPTKERESLSNIVSRRYTSLADVLLMNRMLRLTQNSGVQPTIHFARDFQVRNLKAHNVILMGSKRSTLWTELFESQMNFRFVQQGEHLRVINSMPQPNELPFYDRLDASHGHAIIAFLPNLDRVGNVLTLQGDDQLSTEAAGELVTNEEAFAAFRQRLGDTKGRLPWFEVLLRTQKVGNATSAFEIIALRVKK